MRSRYCCTIWRDVTRCCSIARRMSAMLVSTTEKGECGFAADARASPEKSKTRSRRINEVWGQIQGQIQGQIRGQIQERRNSSWQKLPTPSPRIAIFLRTRALLRSDLRLKSLACVRERCMLLQAHMARQQR